MTTQLMRPRSISYNDIKKKRMLRQSKSKPKLKNAFPTPPIIATQKKHNPSPTHIYANQRPNQIHPTCQKATPPLTFQIVNHPSQIRDTVKRKIESWPLQSSESQILKTTANDPKDIMSGNVKSREVVRQLIAESKSQRRLLRYKQLRNKFKLSKSRSRTKSATSLVEKSRILAKKLTEIQATPQKPEDNVLKGIKNSNRIKKFESVREQGPSSRSHFRYLVNMPQQKHEQQKQLFRGNKKKQSGKLEQQLESSISLVKNSSQFDSQDDKFLQQMDLKPSKFYRGPVEQQVVGQCNENILDLLDVEHRQLSRAIEKKQREKKIMKDLSKLNKKFPMGFFKL